MPNKVCRVRQILRIVDFTEITAVDTVRVGIYGLRPLFPDRPTCVEAQRQRALRLRRLLSRLPVVNLRPVAYATGAEKSDNASPDAGAIGYEEQRQRFPLNMPDVRRKADSEKRRQPKRMKNDGRKGLSTGRANGFLRAFRGAAAGPVARKAARRDESETI